MKQLVTLPKAVVMPKQKILTAQVHGMRLLQYAGIEAENLTRTRGLVAGRIPARHLRTSKMC